MLLFTDIDNTVIYSHRRMVPEPIVWVETLNEKRQSFVTQRAYQFYRTQDWLRVVPITTRTLQQCGRLKAMFSCFGWKDALICNGSILLRDGIEDSKWTKESLEISRRDRDAFFRSYETAQKLTAGNGMVLVEPFLYYVKTAEVERVFSILSQEADQEHLSILQDSRKVYCIPNSLNKGSAAKRYQERFGHPSFLAAGDSAFDVPMLRLAQRCLCPEGMASFEAVGTKIVCCGLFSDSICEQLEELRKEV